MTESGFRRVCLGILIILTLVASWSGFNIMRDGLHIDTNLKSLSPPLSKDNAVNHAVDTMTTEAAKKIIIVLASKNSDDLDEANQTLREKISGEQDNGLVKNPIQYADQSAAMKAYLELLIKHRFYIAGKNAQSLLTQPDDEKILAAAKENFYGSGGSLRLVPLASDPLGFVNEYALGVLNKLSFTIQEDVHDSVIRGENLFISTHALQLSADALEMGEQDKALAAVNSLKQEILQQYPSVEFMQSGIIFFAADSARTAKDDINLISTGSTIGVIFLFLWIFRSFKSLLIPVVSMILGPLFALCICQMFFGSIHILTIVFGASLIGVVGDYSLHFYYFYNKKTSSENILQLYRALLLSLMTSAIGYGALALSGLDALKQVAVFSGLGLVYSWLLVISLGSYLIKDDSIRVHDSFLQKIVARLLIIFSKLSYRAYISLAFIVLLALLIVTRFSFPANDSPKAFFALNPSLVAEEKIINGLVSTYEPSSFIVVDADNAQELYDRIESLQKILGEDAQSLFGVHDFFPSPKQQLSTYEANKHIYGEQDGIAAKFLQQNAINSITATDLSNDYRKSALQTLSPQEFFSQKELPFLPFWIESETRIYSFILLPKSLDTTNLAQRLSTLEHVKFVSAIADIENSLRHLRFSALELLFVALAMISVLVYLHYKLHLMLKIMTVPAFSIVLSLAGLAALGIPITLFHIMALFLVLGLSMDYVIFAAEMHENAVATLSAIVLAAITSLLSFGLLVFSSLPAVSAFGITVIIGSALNLFGAMALASQKIKPYKFAQIN